MFLRRWLANFGDPLLGRTMPAGRSAHEPCRRRGGTGTRGADRCDLAGPPGGRPAERLIVVEFVPEMANHLHGALPGVLVVEGDARNLPGLLPRHWHGRIGSVVCGIPLVLQPLAEQRRLIAAIEAVAPGRGFLHCSYCATSPLPCRKHALAARREAWTPLNFPPASVWRYTTA
jgi:phosphatidylethanolamine/phosphatidyl-N-methylethanolamine N-methyltransferase